MKSALGTSFFRPLKAPMFTLALWATSAAMAQQTAPPPPPPGQNGDAPPNGEGQRERGQREGRGFGGRMGGRMGQFVRFNEIFQPDFVRSDVQLFVEELKLADAQRDILEALYETYDAAYHEKADPTQEKLREAGDQIRQSMMPDQIRQRIRQEFERGFEEFRRMQEEGGQVDPEQMREKAQHRLQGLQEEIQRMRDESGEAKQTDKIISDMIRELENFRGAKRTLRDEFMVNVRSQLEGLQTVEWPAVERKLTRLKSLPKGRISGESLDLLRVLDESDLDESTMEKLAPAKVEYESAIDLALRQRDEKLAVGETQLFRVVTQGKVKEAMQIMERQAAAHVSVREVNDQYVEIFASSMDEPTADAFKKKAWGEAFDELQRTTYTQRVIESVKEMEGIDPTVLLAVEEIETAYLRELDIANKKIMDATRKQEPKELARQAQQAADFFSGNLVGMFSGGPFGRDDNDDPVNKARDERREMGDRYIDRIKAMLSPDQVGQLPERRQNRGPGQRFGQGGAGMSPEQQQEIVKRYDKNGDGQLDEAERQAMFDEWRRNNGRGRQEG